MIQMKRRPILLNKLNLKNRDKGKVIAVSGVSRAVGVTHLVIVLGNYFEKLGKKVALIEMNANKAFEKIEKAYEGVHFNVDETTFFNIKRCTYYKNTKGLSLIDILAKNYDYYILDIGFKNEKYFGEFLRADIQVVVGMVSEWKKDEVLHFYNTNKDTPSNYNWIYACTYGSNSDIKDMQKIIDNKIFSIPFNPDPFIIKPEMKKVIQEVML
ncbi:hypothetical protein EDC19_0070 [Natranaerovirga hydrolytica]|uniref:MinD-like ATPase involved in chromosome partitioning or flagellar assembly n=2 Tax=Natranaerovirga hydrolytica TaxID=680378 RepID=A0A4V2Q1X1_9FIRM|nr:hypothetical protein EDC19_0070 [Natranaerovirga hydrolytica]